jgi:hypothetical protein
VTDRTTTVAGLSAAEEDFARGLRERAKAEGVSLVGPGGLLQEETGLKETIRVRPFETVTVTSRFTHYTGLTWCTATSSATRTGR